MEEVLTIYTNSKKQINVEVVTVLFAFLIVKELQFYPNRKELQFYN